MEFQGKNVIVTGAAKGIGAAIAAEFLHSGARVAVFDIDSASDGEPQAGREAVYFQCDVSSEVDVASAVAAFAERFGPIDVLVNNAGIFPRGTLLETDEALWDRVMGINLKGVYLMCRAVAPLMIQRQSGSIINIGSLHAKKGDDTTFAYAISKSGVVTLTRNLAHFLAPHRIRVNGIHPGWIASDGELARLDASGMTREELERRSQALPLGRMQTGEDIARAAHFLASERADQITGQLIAVDGGLGNRF